MAQNRFKIIEHFNGFAIEDTVTKKEALLTNNKSVSDMCSVNGLENEFNRWPEGTLEAYFPEQYQKEG